MWKLIKENKELKEENKELKKENIHLRYMPGMPGCIEAEEEFNSLK